MSVDIDRSKLVRITKQQFIVDAAKDLIAKIGIDKINMDEIASEANYTKRTLYSYFQGKDEILLWVYTDDLKRRWEYQKSQIHSADNGIDNLKIWCHSLFKYCDINPQSLWIQNYMDYRFVQIDNVDAVVFEKFESINNELAEGLREIFTKGINDGSFNKEIEIDLVISQFLYSFRAILNRAFSKTYSFANFDKLVYVDHYITLFLKSIVV
jgi:AcrR family transcriptional regulator